MLEGAAPMFKNFESIIDRFVFAFRSFWFLFQLLTTLDGQTSMNLSFFYLILFIVAYFVPHFFWFPGFRNNRQTFCFLELILSGFILLCATIQYHSVPNFFLVPALVIGYLISKNIYRIIPFVFMSSFLGLIVDKVSFVNIGSGLFNTALFFGIGFGYNLLIQANKKSSYLMKVVEDQNKTIEQLTIVEERNRMAKELHDTLGHSFISYIMGLDAVIYILDSDPSLAKEKLDSLRKLTTRNLDEIRKTIHDIAVDLDHTLGESLKNIVNEFIHYTSTDVNFVVDGEEYYVQQSCKIVLIRCLQESLTNAKKHGNASLIEVRIEFNPDKIVLIVRDNGLGTDKYKTGFGLKTMKERIDSVNGEFIFTSKRKVGSNVTCIIPRGSSK
jgi:signal transduction histidine kinase